MKKFILFLFILITFSFFSFAQNQEDSIYDAAESSDETDQELPHLYTFVDSPVVEQRQVLTKEDIENLHVQTAAELFRNSGIQLLSYGSYGMQANPSIRGFTGGTVRVVIDGICMNSAQNGDFDYSSLNLDDIEKIEIVRGGFTEGVTGEGAAGAVIYITTRKQTLGTSFDADLYFKSYLNANSLLDTAGLYFGARTQTGENTFLKGTCAATMAQNAFLYYNNLHRHVENKNAGVKDGNLHGNIIHYFGNGNSFSFDESFYGGVKNISSSSGLQQDYNNNASFSINIPSAADSVTLSSVLDWKSCNEFYSSSAENSTHLLNSFTSTTTALFFPFKNWKQTAGLTLDCSVLDSTNTGFHSVFSGTLKETSFLYINDVLSLTFPMGVTFSGNNFAFLPKAGIKASFVFGDILADVYRMVLFPTMNQLYWQGAGAYGNENLKAEKGWGGEITFNSSFKYLPFSVCLFTNYYFSKIKWSTDSDGNYTPVNLASAFYCGVDFSIERKFLECFTLRANCEYLYNTLLDSSHLGKRIMWTPDFVASVSCILDLYGFSFCIDADYTGLQYEENENINAVQPYTIVNMSVAWNGSSFIRPYIKADNLLNASYEAVPGYPMPGFSLTIGAKASW